MRLVALVYTDPAARDAQLGELQRALSDLPSDVSELRRSQVGPHFPGSIGGGRFTWDALLDGDDPTALLKTPGLVQLQADVIRKLDVVALRPHTVEVPEPEIQNSVKRTLLLRVIPGTSAEQVAAFERDLMGMPRHIHSIRNWALSHAHPGAGSTRWTHVWEQEYADVNGLEVDYMMHPYHWGLVDGWFDPECPQRIVDTRLAHVYRPAPSTVLGWE